MAPAPAVGRPTNKELFDFYVRRKMSIHQIARDTGFSRRSIVRWIRQSGTINLRTPDEVGLMLRRNVAPDQTTLHHLYWVERLSLSQIGQRFGATETWALGLMKRYGIPRRTLSDAGMEFPKTDFSGNPIEKAYLVGFRTGDLNCVLDTNQVRISSSTTHPAQWELVSSIFGRYGRVNRTPVRTKGAFEWMLYGYLNHTFDFLLKKQFSIPGEIAGDRQLFLSFLSRYFDAEGNLRIYEDDQRTTISLRIHSEDETILRDIRKGLLMMGYHVYFGLQRRKGTYDGKKQGRDVWGLGMFRQKEVLDLLSWLTLRHAEKIEWARLASLLLGKPWVEAKLLVLSHKERIRQGLLEFAALAESEFARKHELG